MTMPTPATITHVVNGYSWEPGWGPTTCPFTESGRENLMICCNHEADNYRLRLVLKARDEQLDLARRHIAGMEADAQRRGPALLADRLPEPVQAEGTAW